MKNIEYEEIGLLKQSGKSTVLLVRETGGERVFVRKILKGKISAYSELIGCANPYLPELYEVSVTDNTTEVIEEYIDGQPLGCEELTEKQLLGAIKELCSVLEFLHGKGIIHRDIKPSNIILAKDGHIRLIDFDAARMKKDGLGQDTRLLGTRGYAPPEQYGFAQTDERSDIYALGVTLEQLLGNNARKPRYRRIIQKCTNKNPDKRYQSARQVGRAFSRGKRGALYSCTALLLIVCLWCVIPDSPMQKEGMPDSASLTVLPAPENPHWDGETGIGVWGNVPESGDEAVAYKLRIYRRDTATPPDLNDGAYLEGSAQGNGGEDKSFPTYQLSMAITMQENGFYYFAVSAVGDGVNYADSPYAMSDAFEYTGASAPPLPAPTGLEWKVVQHEKGRSVYAAWDNLNDYMDLDTFHVGVYDEAGTLIANNEWTKEFIKSIGQGGVWIAPEIFSQADGAYRFTVQVESSRPNEYRSSPMPYPVPEEYYSPWYSPQDG